MSLDYMSNLNAEQQMAVTTVDGPLLVLSGAGTGKTRVLTTRIAYILATKRANPWQILAVTFTNKASREMKDRLEKMIHDEICEPTGRGIAKDPETLRCEAQEAEDERITIEFLKYASEHDGIRKEHAYSIQGNKTYADFLLEEAVNKGLLERCLGAVYGGDLPHYTITQLGRRKILGR